MTTVDLDAAWGIVLDATPVGSAVRLGWRMRGGRPTLQLATLVALAVLAACLPRTPSSALPGAVAERLGHGGWAFTSASPGAGMLDADEAVARVSERAGQGRLQMLGSRPVPVFGVLSCKSVVADCQPGTNTGSVWLIYFPDWARRDGDIGFAVIDPVTGKSIMTSFVEGP